MATSGSTQALVATFAFGAVALAASGAAFLFIRGNGKSLFRDGLRLVLAAFFISAALWSIIGFAATLIYAPAATSCQVLVAFFAAFDQLARIAIEQFLLLQIKAGRKPSSASFILQAVILLRFILGGVFVGVQRPQFQPVCVGSNLLLPLGIAALATDGLFVLVLFLQLASVGLLLRKHQADPGYARVKSLFLTTVALGVWLSMSIPMILGIKSFALAARTVVPAAGLLILLGVVALCKNSLILIIPSIPELPPSAPATRSMDIDKALPAPPVFSRSADTVGRSRDNNTDVQQYQENADLSPSPSQNSTSRGVKTLPIIDRPSPGQTERGMGGVPVQGQLFPPIRASTAPVIMQKPPKKVLKKPGKIVISQPVIRESSSQNLMKKFTMVDLETAAKNDKERRAMQSSTMAQRQTAPTERNALKNPQLFKRKEVASAAVTRSIETKGTPSLLAPDATSTSAQVSPGMQDVRRRSPRSITDRVVEASKSQPLPHVAELMSPPPRSSRPSVIGSQRQKATQAPAQHPKRRSSKSPLRQSSDTQIFIDPNTPPVIPSPLRQEKPKWPSSADMGSPLVPRVKPLPMPFPKSHSRHNYAEGQNKYSSDTRLSLAPPGSSVKHDIRPSRQRPQSPLPEIQGPAKTPVQLRPVAGIPLNPRSRHAHSHSNGSGDKTDTVMFLNGSHDAGKAKPLQEWFRTHNAASAARDSVVHRPRPIPRRSQIYTPDFTVKLSPTVYRRRSRSVGSIELTRTSMESGSEQLSSIPVFPQPPRSASAVMMNSGNQKANKRSTLREIASEGLEQSSSSVHSVLETSTTTGPSTTSSKFHEDSRRQSSPLLPASEMRHLSLGAVGDAGRLSGATAVGGQKSARGETTEDENPADTTQNDGRETVVVMLDTASEGSCNPGSRRNSDYAVKPTSWHRRIGDICPTFSVREAGGRSPRRVPPPTPLLLGKPTRSVLANETQLSPLESPQHALDAIQEQLRRLETAENEDATETQDNQRRTLLENIEAEMGAQESHWLQIREELAGRSPANRWSQTRTQTPASGDLNLTSPAPSLNKNGREQSGSESSRSGDAPEASLPGQGSWRPQQNGPGDEKFLGSPRSPPDESTVVQRRSGGSGVSITSDDAAAGAGFVGAGGVESRTEPGTPSTPSTLSSPTQNKRLLSASVRSVAHHLGSPTPPDTDESDVESVENTDFDLIAPASFVSGTSPASLAGRGLTRTLTPPGVYQPTYQLPYQPVSHWSIESDATSVALQALKSPDPGFESPISAKQLKPLSVSPKPDSPVAIKDNSRENDTSKVDIPGGDVIPVVSLTQAAENPRQSLAQKPPRRSKRITLLPDIPESPKPLENKRGTLGIFQFPWGETSDIATLQPQRITYMAMPGTMASGVPVATVPVLESQSYPTSFFDHYDEEEGSEIAAPDSDNDEEFDENTLWEIASLLKSDKIPSRGSLFPEYEQERPPSRAGFPMEASHDQSAATEKPLPPLPLAPSLWPGKRIYAQVSRNDKWMPQPDKKVWKALVEKSSQTLRTPPRKAEVTPIYSSSLWKPAEKEVEEPKTESLWLWEKPKHKRTQKAELTQTSEHAAKVSRPAQLWTTPIYIPPIPRGLPQTPETWNKYLSTKVKPLRVKPRAAKVTPIRSSSLWTPPTQQSESTMASSTPFSKPRSPPLSSSTKPLLWTHPPKLPEEQTEGLFSLNHIRHDYRTSPNKPAALETKRKLSPDTRPLPILKSTCLWSHASVSHILNPPPPQNWLALSSHQQQPDSPASASVTDSDASETSSVQSEETGTSTLASSAVFRKRTAPTTAERDELDSALQQALASRAPAAEDNDDSDKLFFDVTTSHPVFAVDVLHITSDTCHPAATGYLHTVINGAPRKKAPAWAKKW